MCFLTTRNGRSFNVVACVVKAAHTVLFTNWYIVSSSMLVSFFLPAA